MPAKIAIIGGTGLTTLQRLIIDAEETVNTPYGAPSSPLIHGTLAGQPLVFIARHGAQHTIPPHKINYRANLWALRQSGAQWVIAVASVGGISSAMRPGRLAIPDQVIDYTWGRANTFCEDGATPVTHIDFSQPYCAMLRKTLIAAAQELDVDAAPTATYAATQGPRLESAAEVSRLERDGCHIVGMTGMPEAALARELELHYATCAVVANWAAGKADVPITLEAIERGMANSMGAVRKLLVRAASRLGESAGHCSTCSRHPDL